MRNSRSSKVDPAGAEPVPSLFLRSALTAACAAGAYVTSEWLFFATKPSMFSALTWPHRIVVLLVSVVPATLVTVLAGLVLAAVAALVSRRAAAWAGAAPTALVGGVTVFLVVENFTRTIFGFNIGSFTSAARYLYLAALILVVAVLASRTARFLLAPRRWFERGLAIGILLLLSTAILVAGARYRSGAEAEVFDSGSAAGGFNVLLLSCDGIDANRMSVYGYERPTTPFLETRREELLVVENHFANSANTAGANGALLSGKLPTTTGVVEQLDAFQGKHIYQHLPGILRQMGYYGIQVGARQYVDARAQNLRNGFVVANGRTLEGGGQSLLTRYGRSYPSERHFLELSLERLSLRLLHAAGRIDLNEVVAPVVGDQPSWSSDRGRVEALLAEIDRAPRPFFAHIHLLDSHGPTFRLARQHFSAGRRQAEPFERDFLDDAIRGFDAYVEEIFGSLKATGELERTLVVISSDHGLFWSTASRMPLLLRFPGAARTGSLAISTQTIDIAPTVLEFLGVVPPAWLEGRSILAGEREPRRPFISTGKTANEAFLVQCQRWFRLDLVTADLSQGRIADHTAPCDGRRLLEAHEARGELMAAIGGSSHFRQPVFVGERLAELAKRPNQAARRELIADVLAGKTPVRWLDEDTRLLRVHWDFWTRATEPAGILVRNPGASATTKRLVVSSGRGREFPLRFYVEDGEETRELVFSGPGRVEVDLGPIAAGSERLFIVWAASAWSPGPQDRRWLGVKLSVPVP